MSDSDKITIPMSKDDLLDTLARIMRDRAYPEFGLAPPPLWATDAAQTILTLFEDLTKLTLAAARVSGDPAGLRRNVGMVLAEMDRHGTAEPVHENTFVMWRETLRAAHGSPAASREPSRE